MAAVRDGTGRNGAVRGRPPRRTLSESIADELGAAVTKGEYAAGERLREQEIAARFSVSRGPVREALRILVQRGLAVMMPRRGVRVVELNPDGLLDLFNVRAVLMGLAARYFALMADEEARQQLVAALEAVTEVARAGDADSGRFIEATSRVSHLIARRCGSDELARLIEHQNHRSAWSTLWQSGRIDFTTRERRLASAVDYNELGNAVAERNGARAEAVMRRMVMLSRENAVSTITGARKPDYDVRRLQVA